MKKKRRKRPYKKQFHRGRGLTAAAALAICVIIAAAGILIGRISQKGVPDSRLQEAENGVYQEKKTTPVEPIVQSDEPRWESGAEAVTEGADTVPEYAGNNEEAESNSGIQTEEQASKPASDVVLSEEDAAAERQPESEPAGQPALQTAVWEGLEALPAGTILPENQLNLIDLSQYFTAVPIEAGDPVYNRINGKSWQENEHIALCDLRYLKLLHYNFSGQIQVGELIVNKDIADDVVGIFEELFACGYQIQSMYLIDNYWTGDPDDSDTASIDANNTSAFCYRPVTNGTKLSNHAYGRAIDINPQQNPYVSYSGGSPKWYHENADDYIARDTGLAHVITHEDAAFLIFQKYGFLWGGDWSNPKDYQHFEKR